MGAWDFGPFDNDVAADWVDEINGLESDDARTEATWRAITDVMQSETYRASADEGDIALAAAAWVTAPLTGTRFPGSPDADPPRLTPELRGAVQDAFYSALLQPHSEWLTRQREAGPAALEAAYAINAAIGNRPPPEIEEHWATVTPVRGSKVLRARQDPRFRVYFFAPKRNGGWSVRADDITDGEVTDALCHAEDNARAGEWLAIALISDRAGDGQDHVWLMGKDPRETAETDDDRMRIRRMGGRADLMAESSGP